MTTRSTAKTTLRVSPEDLAEIDQRARAHGISRTKLMVAATLGRDLPYTIPAGLPERVEALERQMAVAREFMRPFGVSVDGEAA